MRGLRIAAWGIALATAVSLAIGLLHVLDVIPTRNKDQLTLPLFPVVALILLAPTVVGLLIAVQQPRNRIAWILLLGPFALSLTLIAEHLVGAGWALQIDRATPPLLLAWPLAVAFVFPNGRLSSRRWRWVAGAVATCFVVLTVMTLLDPTAYPSPNTSIRNPLLGNDAGEFVVSSGVWIPFGIGILVSLLAGALAVWLRFRKSAGLERLQMLWLVWAAALIPLGLAFGLLAEALFGPAFGVFAFLLLAATDLAAVAAVGIAVLRYRLFAIERLVNQTAVYASLTLLLVATYAGITVVLGVVVGGGSNWVIALATLVVAVVFRPLRSRLQDLVDRRFSRARYEGVRRVRDFEAEVREGRRAPEEIGVVLTEALGDSLAEVLFWLPETEAYAHASGGIVADLPRDDRARTEIMREGARTAVLLHAPVLLQRRDFLNGVVGAARLSIEMARLRVELRLQLAEVAASRTRIVEAGDEERRRLERDLHDGAQQRLVSLGVQIRRLQRSLPREARILSPAFDQIVAEVSATIGDLRQIAAGIRPARLDDGLSAALLDLARSAPVPVDVQGPGERVAASVEAAAYFVACEALTNAIKYASASKVSMQAARENGSLHVRVSDDGVGGAVLRRGSGLAGLQDRVAALGGTLEVVSPRGEGTRIEVTIPCAS